MRSQTILAAGLVLLVEGAALAAPKALEGFPARLGRGNHPRAVAIAKLDSGPSVVVTFDKGLAIVDASGAVRPGFPVRVFDPASPTPVQVSTPAAICDVDGNGRADMVFGGSDKRLYAVSQTGAMTTGFPVLLDGKPRGPVACLVAGSRRYDLVLTTSAGSLVVVSKGKPRTVATIGRGAESGVAIADLNGDRKPELIAVGGDSRLYAFDLRGKALKGFPYKMSFRSSGIPSVGDLDDDGKPDIAIGSQDFKLHAVSARGKPLAGFPVETGYRIYGGVALGDVDGNAVLDAVVGSGDKKLYAVDGAGKALKGFPVDLGGRINVDCALGDVDRDGKTDILATTDDGKLFQITAKGKKSTIRIKGKAVTAPVLGDLDGDGRPEVVVATKDWAVHAMEIEPRGKAEAALLDWPMPGHDLRHSGRFGPNPARLKDLSFKTPEPATTDALVVEYTYFDVDGDAERDTQVRWYQNGKHIPALDNARTVGSDKTIKHQAWRYTLQAGDNFAKYGEDGVLTRRVLSPVVTIKNTKPGKPRIQLAPLTPRTDATLEVTVTGASTDADGDSIAYRYAWLRDGKVVRLKPSQQRVGPARTRKNEEWVAVVVPFDGEVEGETATASVKILNTPPPAPEISVTPSAPRIVDTAKVNIVRQPPDVDGDTVTYTYRYVVDGRRLDLPPARGLIPKGTLRKHQKVRVEVTAHDDQEAGGKVHTELEVTNTPPPSPKIAIWPKNPRTGDNLVVGLLGTVRDADADVVELGHQWSVDGHPVDHPRTVPSSATKKGQRWRLTVTPFDGEATGTSVTAETVILNTPPVAPTVALERYAVTTDETIAPKIAAEAKDADGDPIRLKYRWLNSGKPSGLPESKAVLKAAETRKGDTWTLDVVPSDGIADGAPFRLAVRVVNSAPEAPAIRLSSTTPTVRDRVGVEIAKASTDKDGDRVRYKYRWFRNGSLMEGWKAQKTALEPGEARKGEAWRVEVRAYDGEAAGEAAIAEWRVRNHPPGQPTIALRASRGRTRDDLQCERVKAARDPDGDRLTYRTYWLVDGKPVPLSLDAAKLPSTLTRKGQRWTCEVEAFDGEATSARARTPPLTIGNTPPQPPRISISPASPRTDVDLECQLDQPARDADLDRIRYSYVWRVNGKRAKDRARAPNVVPASQTRRGQTWECEVTPSDPQASGASARARVSIENSAPTPPQVRIVPERPVSGDRLTCEIVAASRDADKDRISYRYIWLKDGVAQTFAPTSTEVPGRLVKAKDLWKCEVTPADALVSGPSASSPNVVIGRAPH